MIKICVESRAIGSWKRPVSNKETSCTQGLVKIVANISCLCLKTQIAIFTIYYLNAVFTMEKLENSLCKEDHCSLRSYMRYT